MGKLKFKHKRLRCRKCNAEYGGHNYLVFKDGYGWVCPRCGYEKPVKEWEKAKM